MLEDKCMASDKRDWALNAIKLMEADARRSADSHLVPLDVPAFADIDIYLKDESTHPTGSLKHRLARSLILYGICNGLVGPTTTLIEASSGSTAVSEAYYAKLLGLRFFAVLPRSTTQSKVDAIQRLGGCCHFVDDPAAIYEEARMLAGRENGYYLDQFTYAERATDWRGNNNIAESIFQQMSMERHPEPHWVVMSPGTGGTSATIGRYILYRGAPTRLCVPDPEFSAFYQGWGHGDMDVICERGSRIEGIGRPRMEASFIPTVVDAMLKVPDAVSIAAARVLSHLLGRRVGGSTGTNFVGVLWAASQMHQDKTAGSIVSMICDSGERYAQTYFDDAWLAQEKLDVAPIEAKLRAILDSGVFDPGLLLGVRQR